MPKKTYYEILGVPRTATVQQIKRRYRELVRTHHPDVAEDKTAAKAAFIEISEAYQTLINPDKRVIYDASLDAQMFRPQVGRPRSSGPSYAPGRQARPEQTTARSRVAEAQRWAQEAQELFIRGQFRSAVWACRQAQSLDRRNAQAHVILGDIYRVQGRVEDAIAMYTIAAQLDPRNTDVQAKLNRLAQQHRPGRPMRAGERQAALKMGLNLMGGSVAAFLLMLLYMSPGQPIVWLQQNLPFVGAWSTMLVSVLLTVGILTGFLLSVNGAVETLDDALVFQAIRSPGPHRASYPVGLLLIVFNLFSFYLAAGIYAVIGLVQESISKSVVTALVATFVLVLLASAVYLPGKSQVLLFGGNIAFPALLFGWAVGDIFRPGW